MGLIHSNTNTHTKMQGANTFWMEECVFALVLAKERKLIFNLKISVKREVTMKIIN